jgi:hypothetical protein
MLEIKELNELLDSIIALGEAIEHDSKDGKLTVLEILGNYPDILKVIEEGKDYKLIIAELKDLDEAEILEITQKLIQFVFIVLQTIKNLK